MIAKERTLTLLRRAGIVGIVTGVALSIADISLLYSPAGGYESDAMLLTIPMWRLLLGHYLGVLMLPFYLIAVWHLYEGLKPGGAWFAMLIFLTPNLVSTLLLPAAASLSLLILFGFSTALLWNGGREPQPGRQPA